MSARQVSRPRSTGSSSGSRRIEFVRPLPTPNFSRPGSGRTSSTRRSLCSGRNLERAQQRTETLEAQVATAAAELERAQQRAEALGKQNVVLSASVNESRESVQALEARNAELTAELERSRDVVRERERLLEHLDAQLWIRVGRRLRAVT